MADAKDLSRIDFSKCRLPPWRNWLMVATIPLGCATVHVKPTRDCFTGATVARLENGERWLFDHLDGSQWGEVEALKRITETVDAFIASELARIAKEEEAANWVDVPWQDAKWLTVKGVCVHRYNVSAWMPHVSTDTSQQFANHFYRYLADRRTFPAGYDPQAPRWVGVTRADAERLLSLGVKYNCSEPGLYHGDDDRNYPYRIDIHTLPPGVPLHVEPTKKATELVKSREMTADEFVRHLMANPGERVRARQHSLERQYWYTPDEGFRQTKWPSAPDGHVDVQALYRGGTLHVFGLDEKPEQQWLPCTREEAEAHPDESEVTFGTRSEWCRVTEANKFVSVDLYRSHQDKRRRPEYRTTAKLDTWVTVPWSDADMLRKSGASVEYQHGSTGVWAPSTIAAPVLQYRAARTTLPPDYVLGVGFVEVER